MVRGGNPQLDLLSAARKTEKSNHNGESRALHDESFLGRNKQPRKRVRGESDQIGLAGRVGTEFSARSRVVQGTGILRPHKVRYPRRGGESNH